MCKREGRQVEKETKEKRQTSIEREQGEKGNREKRETRKDGKQGEAENKGISSGEAGAWGEQKNGECCIRRRATVAEEKERQRKET